MDEKKLQGVRLGRWGEAKAEKYLINQGIRVISHNERTKYGEIDIVGLDQNTLIFSEVKTSKTRKYGYPEVSVNQKKQLKMVESALKYIQDHPDCELNWRIDVIAINILDNEKEEIRWFKNAVTG